MIQFIKSETTTTKTLPNTDLRLSNSCWKREGGGQGVDRVLPEVAHNNSYGFHQGLITAYKTTLTQTYWSTVTLNLKE